MSKRIFSDTKFLFCLQCCDLIQQLRTAFTLISLVFLVLPSCIKMVSVTASLSLIKRYKYLCLKGQGQKSKNEAWGKGGLRNDQFGFCILPRNRVLKKTLNHAYYLLATYMIIISPSLICVYVSYINQQITTFLSRYIHSGEKDPILSPVFFFCLNNPKIVNNDESDKQIFF